MDEEKLTKSNLKKIKERLNRLEKENKELKQEVKSLKDNSGQVQNKDKEKLSRREFLKKAGLGTAGLAAMMSPVSALDIRSNNLKFFSDGENTPKFEISSNGLLNAENTLKMNDNDINNINILGSGNGQYINLQAGDQNEISLNYGNEEAIRFYNYNTGKTALKTQGNNIKIPNGNLQLATGQAIEDSEGTRRFGIGYNTTGTQMYYDDGIAAINADSSTRLTLQAKENNPITIRDRYGGFDALEYRPSSSTSGTFELKNAHLNHRPANNTTFRSIFAPNNNDENDKFTFEETFHTTQDGTSLPGIRTIYIDRPGDTTYSASVREASLEKRIIVGQTGTTAMTEQTGWFLDSGPNDEYSARFGVSTDNPENPFEVYDEQLGTKTFRVQDNGPVSVEKVDILLDTDHVIRWGNNGARIAYENGELVAYNDDGNSTTLI